MPWGVCYLLLAACSGDDGIENSQAEKAAIPLLQEQEDGSLTVSPDGAFLYENHTYRAIASRILQTRPVGGASIVEAARLRSRALEQTQYPQFRPTASLNQDGDPVARFGVSQIIFSNGQFQAEKGSLRAEEIRALAEYLISANQRVADGITVYFEVEHFEQLAQTAKELESRYRVLVDQAERRVTGGVGDETEIATFKLKLLEAKSDVQTNQLNGQLAEAELRDLTADFPLPATPPLLQAVAPSFEPPEVVLLLAQIASAESEVELERSRRRPSVSLEAFSESNLNTGQSDDGLSLSVGVSVPLGIRNDLEIEAAKATKDALEADLKAAQSDVARRATQLRARVRSETTRLDTLRDLVAAAKKRLDNFDEQFLSGSVSIEEAVSVLETYRRSRDQLTDARNEILKAELELARTYGQLLPNPN